MPIRTGVPRGMSVVKDAVARKMASLWPHLDERQRWLVLGAEARELGRGGVKLVAAAAAGCRRTRSRRPAGIGVRSGAQGFGCGGRAAVVRPDRDRTGRGRRAHPRVTSAVDLVALTAASTAREGACPACAAARSAAAVCARVQRCTLTGFVAGFVAVARPPGPLGGLGEASAGPRRPGQQQLRRARPVGQAHMGVLVAHRGPPSSCAALRI
jgi:hypothetical protein